MVHVEYEYYPVHDGNRKFGTEAAYFPKAWGPMEYA